MIASLVSRIRTPITLTALPVARLRPSVRGRARGPPGDADARATLTREELETLAAPLLARVQEACVTALSKAGVASRSTVHSVELVGGLSRMPALQAAVADAVGRPVARTLIAEESVARGAALAAAQLSSFMKVRPLSLREGLRRSLTVSWAPRDSDPGGGGGAASGSEIFAVGVELPARKRILLRTTRPVCVRIADSVGGGGRDGDEDVAAAVFEVRPPLPRVIPDGMLGAGDQPQAVAVDVYIDALTQLPSVSAATLRPPTPPPMPRPRPVEAGVNRQVAEGTAGDKAGAEAPAPHPPSLPSPPGLVEVVRVRWMGLSAAALTAYAAEEAEMRSHEAQVARTLSAKNEFEAGVYALRARLDDDLGAHGGGSSMRESLRGALDEAEEWLYSESGEAEAAQVYEEELRKLRALFSD